MPSLSVIIPTYRRADILAQCLRHLEEQTIADSIEVIVVSDGHDALTAGLFAERTWRIPVKFFEIPKSQQGVARNFGVQQAKGEYVLFIGDDIYLAHDACERHLEVHGSLPLACPEPVEWAGEGLGMGVAVLGFTTWDPACGITPVMRWLESSGWQFGYPLIARYAHGIIPASMQHKFTYTSHLSLPLTLAKKHPFRTDVHLYGWEDVEWGMRLRDAGVRLLYEPDAKALHHHHITLEDSLKRMETLGRSAVEIQKKVPGFDRVPKGWKQLAYRLLALLPTMAGWHRKAFINQLKSGTDHIR